MTVPGQGFPTVGCRVVADATHDRGRFKPPRRLEPHVTALEFERTVPVDPSVAWDVLVDPVAFEAAAPNLSRVELPDGGIHEGAARHCADTAGRSWDETCTRYVEGETYAFEVDVPNSPVHRRLFRSFGGTFGVELDDGGSRVTMRFDYEPRYGPVGRLLVRAAAGRFRSMAETTLSNLDRTMRERAATRTV